MKHGSTKGSIRTPHGLNILKLHSTRLVKVFMAFATLLVFGACSGIPEATDPLAMVLASGNPKIKRVMDSLDQFEVQIRFTQIDRTNDSIKFKDYDFQVDAHKYFYPASTVKFPIAVLALEKLNEMEGVDRDFRFYVEGDSIETTFAQDISKIFVVSDNEANNRLLEFLGQDDINNRLKSKGIGNVRISHRLGVHSDAVATQPLILYLNDSTTTTLDGTINTPPKHLDLIGIKKGIGFFDEDSIVHEPFDFSLKNYYPIDAQHAVLKRIIFPEVFSENEQFHLSDDQRKFLLTAMHTLPRNDGYDPEEYYDGYCKFFMYGDTRERIPNNMEIYNKVGWAYGTLTDCAYILDTKNHVEFMLTTTILVNKNGIFNDDTYEFDTIGLPFLAELGRQLYSYELHRKK
ncbi:MAG: class A beta-lactamase-related serine hydrolase [Maribacter sp.]|nr:class A beta-lactamase-related serine hydrolase [Maribacter sp.]